MTYRSITSRLLTFLACFSLIGLSQYASGQCWEWEETQKLLAFDAAKYDYFGYSVSIDGDVMVVGAYGDDDSSGSVYVFRHDPYGSGQWVEDTKLRASDGDSYERFGHSVSIDGDAIVVGAWSDDDNGYQSGSAYVFRYDPDGTGQWVEEAKLLAPDGATLARFGSSVSISDDAIVVGAPYDDDKGNYSGSAYVFRHDLDESERWITEAKLLPFDWAKGAYFGNSVSIDGDAIVIGAWANGDIGRKTGSAYVFRNNLNASGDWIQQAKLQASDGHRYDTFGSSVSIDGNAIAVGAWHDNDNGARSGSTYIYRYDPDGSGDWIEETKLMASDGDEYDTFGSSVSIDGDVVVIGAIWEDDKGTDAGSTYVYRYDPNGAGLWFEEAKLLASDGATEDYFGHAVSTDGETIVIGAYYDDDTDDYSGSAYVYDLTATQYPPLTVSPDPLITGEYGLFEGNKLNPGERAYLAYSLNGLGSTYIPQLNIILNLAEGIRIKTMRTTDSTGYAFVNLEIPPEASGLDIWFQACQHELKTNVVATSIE